MRKSITIPFGDNQFYILKLEGDSGTDDQMTFEEKLIYELYQKTQQLIKITEGELSDIIMDHVTFAPDDYVSDDRERHEEECASDLAGAILDKLKKG